MEKWIPQLYQTKMKIYHEQYNVDIRDIIATKWCHYIFTCSHIFWHWEIFSQFLLRVCSSNPCPGVQESWAKYECFQTFWDDVFSRALTCAKRVQWSTMGKTNWKPMKARKFGYDVKYAWMTVHTSTTCKPMLNVRLSVWWEIACSRLWDIRAHWIEKARTRK